jgi:hypothetical protein
LEENGLRVLENKLLKIICGNKAGDKEQAGIPLSVVDLCAEGVRFESQLEEQIFKLFFLIYVFFIVFLCSRRCGGSMVMNP